jgi:UDP-N-acetylmuramate--alanine ligase
MPAPDDALSSPSSDDTVVDLTRPRRIHLLGVGGAGIGAIASVLAQMGHHVSGSDQSDSAMVDRLRREGVVIHIGHDVAHVEGAELVAASSAVGADNPELVEARRRGVPVWSRAKLLAAICATKRTLAVSGTHGKTTTSTMLALILAEAGWAPSYLIGGDIVGFGHGARWESSSPWLVVEADESDGTFLELGAEAVIVTSVEPDHLDFYGDEAHMRDAYVAFLRDALGPRVVCADDAGALAVAARVSGEVITYGTSPAATVVMHDVVVGRDGTSFALRRGEDDLGQISLAAPGLHFARNACGALSLAVALGVDATDARAGLAHYRGVSRRFERRGEVAGITLVDDYAHLPSEVRITLATARRGGWSRVVAVFQPHRYSRTASQWKQFGEVFVDADVVVITDVYAAGEPCQAGVTGALIADAARAAHPNADVRYHPERAGLAAMVAELLRPGDVCITLGAGDITALSSQLAVLLDTSP